MKLVVSRTQVRDLSCYLLKNKSIMYYCHMVMQREPKLQEKEGNRFHTMVLSDSGLQSAHRKCSFELKLLSLD